MTRRQAGFSLIEIVVVVLILGILASIAAPAMDGMGPLARLRSGGRKLGAMISEIRAHTGVSGDVHHLHYDLEKRSVHIILPPGKDDEPDMPLEDRERLSSLELPRDVRFLKVIFPDGTVIEDKETVDVPIDPLGYEGDHIVYLANREDTVIAIKFSALLGEVSFHDAEVEYEEF